MRIQPMSGLPEHAAGYSGVALPGAKPLGEIVVGIVDDGFSYDHPFLGGSIVRDLSVDHVDGDASDLLAPDSQHGIAVAGVIAGEASGLNPAAPGVTIAGHRVAFGSVGPEVFADALRAQAEVDVSNNSWGFTSRFGDDFASPEFAGIASAVEYAASEGRGGLGTALVFAAGNGRRSGDNVNHHNLANSQYTIAVGAVDAAGQAADFSTPGAAVLLSALGVKVRTTDRRGEDGYAAGEIATVSGTSFAAPAVSGAIARMYAANPGLGYRDVQTILAMSAAPTDSASAGWQETGTTTWNGGGMTFHHRYGFGVLDADAAVRLSESWTAQSTAANRVEATYAADLASPLAIPDNGEAASYASVFFDVDAAIEIDRVLVDLDIDHTWRGDVVVRLISPQGTQSVLIDRPGLDPEASSGYGDPTDYIRFQVASVAHLGEDARGRWELRVEDWEEHILGRLDAASLSIVGDPSSDDDVHVFTDAFGAASGTVIVDDATGSNTLNFAAVSGAVAVDLAARSASLAGRTLELAPETEISAVYGGGGNDRLSGDATGELIVGGWGNDLIQGRDGDDALSGGLGDDTLDGGAGLDTALFSDVIGAYTILPLELVTLTFSVSAEAGTGGGSDRLTGIERLRFADGVVDALSFFPEDPPVPDPEPEPVPDDGLTSLADLAGLVTWYDATAAAATGPADRLQDLSGRGNDAVSSSTATRADLASGWYFDGGDRYQIADSTDINIGGPFNGKTFAFAVDFGSSVAERQVLWEQGGATRGVSLYVEAGQLVANVWNLAEERWGPVSVSTTVTVEERAVVTFSLDAAAGTLTAWKNGEQFAEIAGIGTLYAHSDDIGLGDRAGVTLDAAGNRLSGGFEGTLFEAAVFDRALTGAAVADLNAHLMAKWPANGGAQPATSPLAELDGLALRLAAASAPVDTDGDGARDFWQDASLTGNDASGLRGAVELADGAVRFDGSDTFEFADDPTLNTAPKASAKAVTVVFEADDTAGRQVLYEQGGTIRGLLLAIEEGELVWRGWNLAETQWEAETRVDIGPGTKHAVTGVFDREADALSLYLDGAAADVVSGTGLLYAHGDDVGLGGVAGKTRFADGPEAAPSGYRGVMWEVAAQNAAPEADAQMLANPVPLGPDDRRTCRGLPLGDGWIGRRTQTVSGNFRAQTTPRRCRAAMPCRRTEGPARREAGPARRRHGHGPAARFALGDAVRASVEAGCRAARAAAAIGADPDGANSREGRRERSMNLSSVA